MKTTLLASSATKDDLQKLITRYYFGSDISIHGADVHNSKGKIENVQVREKGTRWRFESIKGDDDETEE